MLRLVLTYEKANARPVRLATVGDEKLISSAARAALEEAVLRATAIDEIDPTLGRIELAEAHKLAEILAMFIPNIGNAQPAAVPVM